MHKDSTWVLSCVARQSARGDSENDGGCAVAKYFLAVVFNILFLGFTKTKQGDSLAGQITDKDITIVYLYTPDWGTINLLG